MSGGALSIAFSTGALAAFNPFGFALLPGWAAVLVTGEGASDDLLSRVLRALKAGEPIAIGGSSGSKPGFWSRLLGMFKKKQPA